MFRKHWLLAAVALLILTVAVACDDDEETSGADSMPAAGASPQATKASGDVILATTTSTQDSGLLDVLVPMFEDESGYNVQIIAVGSGAAIEQGSRGDADLVLVHSPAAEQRMVDEGNGIERTLIMHNDFIIVGPESDPAGIAAAATLNDAMTAISSTESQFISRGDESGTNALELSLWEDAGIDPSGGWYEKSGQGMGATLQIAGQRQGYTISDRATYLSQQDTLDLAILLEGESALLNVYHTIVVDPDVHGNVNVDGARAFAAFLVREDVQQVIGEFGVEDYGEPLFFPDAGKPEPTG
ncbi:MAG: substrate-binding domain-containing protein [Dehalococcoidia bacterium]